MVLKTARVFDLLESKRDAFANFDSDAVYRRAQYLQALKRLTKLSSLDIAGQLAGEEAPGALPTSEWDTYHHWRVKFKSGWKNREESFQWVGETIEGVPTFAVDGSQIYLSKDVSIPVALVQVGWYENFHCQAGKYEKDILLEVLAPNDLEASSSGEPREQRVNLRRFQLECDRIAQYLSQHGEGDRRLAFFDGALVATFAEAYEPSVRSAYVDAILPMLRASETCQVPLVAYVDTTYTRDLTAMLQHLFELPEAPQVNDAQLMDGMLQWGDRTPFFICARGGGAAGTRKHFDGLRRDARSDWVCLSENQWGQLSGTAGNACVDSRGGPAGLGGGHRAVRGDYRQGVSLRDRDGGPNGSVAGGGSQHVYAGAAGLVRAVRIGIAVVSQDDQ